jgi:hypothetical protein
MARASGRDNVQYGPPSGGKRAPTRSQVGRHCVEPGCSTILSTYNSSQTCWLHTGLATRHPLAKS